MTFSLKNQLKIACLKCYECKALTPDRLDLNS
jgi:hypothetical protein